MTENSKEQRKLYVVGIGASAGGLNALNRLFENIPDNTGMTFVVIQHLSPDYESHMESLLSKKTGMEVCQVQDGVNISPDTVYLIPPKKNLSIYNNQLYLEKKEELKKRQLNLPIDIFLKSLAENSKEKAIAIILSGTGSDGTRGIRAIKEKEGMVMVQKKDTAEFDGMPDSAITTGIVDYILPPEKMGQKLMDYIEHPYINPENNVNKQNTEDENTFNKILNIIKRKTEIDFNLYKEKTVIRRIERRMIINQIQNLNDYLDFLYSSEIEVNTLSRDLLIGVTNFFRDKEAFVVIENDVIPAIISNKSINSEIRIWVAGCSTGEEVFSLAILFAEFMEKHKGNFKTKIFATDVQEDALRQASIGEYPLSIAADISRERQERYFSKKGNIYTINKNIREMVIFSKHDLTQDPPFHKIDLISCRNLLIYLKPELQQKIICNFSFALNNSGFLFLGSSETLGDMFNNFKAIDSKNKVFKIKKKSKEINNIIPDSGNRLKRNNLNTNVEHKINYNKNNKPAKKVFIDKINHFLINDRLPEMAIINFDNQLIHIIGNLNKYLSIPENKVSLDILDMCPFELSQIMSIAVNRVKHQQKMVEYQNINYQKNGNLQKIDIIVKYLDIKNINQDLILIEFKDKAEENLQENKKSEVIDYQKKDHVNQRIKDLEQELEFTKENLQATIEELEASNEELQATNEELMASNEELQSTNEELESVNEELITVNSEHQQKIEELTRLNNDFDNLLKTTNIGTIFLDENLNIRKFTPVVQKVINLREVDVGRPIQDITLNIEYDNLIQDIKQVLSNLKIIEKTIKAENGRWYLMKIMPYRTSNRQVRGVVITLIDINELHQRNEQLRLSNIIINNIEEIIIYYDQNNKIVWSNKKARDHFKVNKGELEGSKCYKLWGHDTFCQDCPVIKAQKTKKIEEGEMKNVDGSIWSVKAYPDLDENGKIKGIIESVLDITSFKKTEQELKKLIDINKKV